MAPELTSPTPPFPVVLRIEHSGDVPRSGPYATAFAASIGFPEKHAEEIGLAVLELATNLVRHAGRGSITLAPVYDDSKAGIWVKS